MGQEFTMTMLTSVADVGLQLSIIIASVYLTSLLHSFNSTKPSQPKSEKQKRAFKLQVVVIIVFVTWIIYTLVNILGRLLMRDKCFIRPALTLTLWAISRAMVYYFFVMRCRIAFEGSSYAFPKSFIVTLIIVIVLFYGFAATFYIVRSPLMIWIPTFQICMPSYLFEDNAWRKVGDALVYVQLSGELLLGVLLVGGYVYKLWQLQRAKEARDIHERSTKEINFFNIGKKQGKLAWIAFVSSLFLLYIAGLCAMWAFNPWLDGIINLTCVYCTFSYKPNVYLHRYLCECNRNKYCLYFWCLLCYCCNEKKESLEDSLALEVKHSDVSSANTTNDADGDMANKS